MRLLLDTHIFLWWIRDAPRLSSRIREAMADPANRLYLSAASTWEMVIKSRLGKLDLPGPPDVFIREQLRMNAIYPLPITVEHTTCLASLPNIHRDPFDRMLVAQAIYEDLTLVTDDPAIRKYPAKILR